MDEQNSCISWPYEFRRQKPGFKEREWVRMTNEWILAIVSWLSNELSLSWFEPVATHCLVGLSCHFFWAGRPAPLSFWWLSLRSLAELSRAPATLAGTIDHVVHKMPPWQEMFSTPLIFDMDACMSPSLNLLLFKGTMSHRKINRDWCLYKWNTIMIRGFPNNAF